MTETLDEGSLEKRFRDAWVRLVPESREIGGNEFTDLCAEVTTATSVDDQLVLLLDELITERSSAFPSYELYRLANKAAWSTRFSTQSLLDCDDPSKFFVFVEVERQRFNFQHDGVQDVIEKAPARMVEEDAVLTAFRAFVELWKSTDRERCEQTVEAVLAQDGVAKYKEAVFDLVAHGLWLNTGLENRGELLERVCKRWRGATGNSPILLFRLAAAHRWQRQYIESIDNVERAMAMVKGNTEFSRTFSEQCVRERELAVAGLEFTRLTDTIQEDLAAKTQELEKNFSQKNTTLEKAVKAQTSSLEDAVVKVEADMRTHEKELTARMIQVVTLFTAAAAFAIGGVSAVGNVGGDPRSTMILIGGFAAALTLFCAVVVLVTHNAFKTDEEPLAEPGRPKEPLRRRQWVWMLGFILLLIIVQAGVMTFLAYFIFPD